MKNLRRNIEWFLTTDFDAHEPTTRETVQAIIMLIILVFIIWVIAS